MSQEENVLFIQIDKMPQINYSDGGQNVTKNSILGWEFRAFLQGNYHIQNF